MPTGINDHSLFITMPINKYRFFFFFLSFFFSSFFFFFFQQRWLFTYIVSPLSIARYSFMQLSKLGDRGENENTQTSKQQEEDSNRTVSFESPTFCHWATVFHVYERRTATMLSCAGYHYIRNVVETILLPSIVGLQMCHPYNRETNCHTKSPTGILWSIANIWLDILSNHPKSIAQ